MVQLQVLSGKQAGQQYHLTDFPCLIGRSSSAVISFEDTGVWEQHLELDLNSSRRFVLKVLPNALAAVNGQSFQEGPLRNGDLIEIGSVRLQFWLSETKQRMLRVREWLVWTVLALVSLAQIDLIIWLLD